jgi:hypothetical protein
MSLGFSGSLPGIFYIDFLYLYLLLANKRDDDDEVSPSGLSKNKNTISARIVTSRSLKRMLNS